MPVTVKQGDTLTAIAKRHGTTVAELAKLNGLPDVNLIRLGQQLRLPGDAFRGTEELKAAAAPMTAAAAREPVPAPPTGEEEFPGLTPREAEVLMRAVAAEARGASPEVQMAVAQAILNRARETGQSVEKLARSTFLSSNFDHNAIYYEMPLEQLPNLEGLRAAVAGAARGESPIGKRSHFYDDRIGTPDWGDPDTEVKIGRMVFLDERKPGKVKAKGEPLPEPEPAVEDELELELEPLDPAL